MKAEPPIGDDLTTLLVTVKGRIMQKAPKTRQRRRRLGLAGIVITSAAILVVGGGGAAIATSYVAGVLHTIPHSTNRPSDPPTPTDYDQNTNNQLTPEEASLSQLWALANSEALGGGSSPAVGAGMTDFAAAVEARCYPLRTDVEVSELQTLRADYESAEPAAQLVPAQAYFARATELCM